MTSVSGIPAVVASVVREAYLGRQLAGTQIGLLRMPGDASVAQVMEPPVFASIDSYGARLGDVGTGGRTLRRPWPAAACPNRRCRAASRGRTPPSWEVS